MLSPDEIRHKVRALDRDAAAAAEPSRAAYRQIALAWRLVEVEAVFFDALRRGLNEARGAFMEALPGAALSPGALDSVLARIDGEAAPASRDHGAD